MGLFLLNKTLRDGGPADFRDTPSSRRCTGYSGMTNSI
jgi:hypothetical protein